MYCDELRVYVNDLKAFIKSYNRRTKNLTNYLIKGSFQEPTVKVIDRYFSFTKFIKRLYREVEFFKNFCNTLNKHEKFILNEYIVKGKDLNIHNEEKGLSKRTVQRKISRIEIKFKNFSKNYTQFLKNVI